MKTSKFLRYALFCLAAVVAFSACKKDEEEPVTPPTEENTPLCFTALEDSSTVAYGISSDSLVIPNFEYSFNGTDWYSFVHTREGWLHGGVEAVVLAKAGDKIYVRNQDKTDALGKGVDEFVAFSFEGKIAASGNVMSVLDKDFVGKKEIRGDWAFVGLFAYNPALVSAPLLPATKLSAHCYHAMFVESGIEQMPDLPATEMKECCYIWMFARCENLIEAKDLPATKLALGCYYNMFSECPNLIKTPALPAVNLDTMCYYDMFRECAALTTTPALPATKMVAACYYNMFINCPNLTTLPELPATELAECCYTAMFEGCNLLTAAPVLPATELAEYCYAYMFKNCHNLNHVEAAFSDWCDSTGTECWLENVAQEGTIVCPANLPEIRGMGFIPEGWTRIDAAKPQNQSKASSQTHVARSRGNAMPSVFKGLEKNSKLANVQRRIRR